MHDVYYSIHKSSAYAYELVCIHCIDMHTMQLYIMHIMHLYGFTVKL